MADEMDFISSPKQGIADDTHVSLAIISIFTCEKI